MYEKRKVENDRRNRNAVITLLVVIVFVLIGAASSGSGAPVVETPPSVSICGTNLSGVNVSPVVYKQLEKDPGSFEGEYATFTGQILQIQQNGNEGFIRMAVVKDGGFWDPSSVVWVAYHQATSAVEGDVVTVTGKLTGAETYTSQANYQITIPSIDVCSVARSPGSAANKPAPVKTPSVSSGVDTPSPSTAPSKPAATWHTIGTYTGNTVKSTAPFTIQGSQWRVSWRGGGQFNFSADAQSPDGSGNFCPIVNVIDVGSDTMYCYGAGTYYLQVVAGDPWTVTVEDYY